MALGYFIFHIHAADTEKTQEDTHFPVFKHLIDFHGKYDEFRLASYTKSRVFLMKYSVPAWLNHGENEIRA